VVEAVVLPLSPDYTGYGGVSLVPEALLPTNRLWISTQLPYQFKYHDFRLAITENTGCVIFSRPVTPPAMSSQMMK